MPNLLDMPILMQIAIQEKAIYASRWSVCLIAMISSQVVLSGTFSNIGMKMS